MKKSFLYLFLFIFSVTAFIACQKEVSLETPGPATATFETDSTTGDCATGIVSGAVVAGRALTDSNFIEVAVNVTTPGSYIIETTTPKGYSYKGTGVFNNTGTTLVKLKGSGTPILTGVDDLTVSLGPFVCTVQVFVADAATPPPGVNDTYFPLTVNSFWRYQDVVAGDTASRAITDSVIRANNTYKRFVQTDPAGDTTHFFFRRAGNDYLEYAYVDNYSILIFEEELYGDILFLKEGLTTGQSWTSAEWTGTDTQDSVVKKLRYVFNCVDANASATIGTNSFQNVYKISFKPQTAPTGSNTWSDEGLTWEAWYVKGVGLINLQANVSLIPIPVYKLEIKTWLVR